MSMQQGDPTSPFNEGVLVVPSDTVPIAGLPATGTRGFYVTGAGDVAMVLAGPGSAALTITCLANSYHPWAVAQFKATGTTATGILAGW